MRMTAYQLGCQAYKDGKMCAPATDGKLMEMIKRMMVGDGADDLFREWQNGWLDKNMAAPIDLTEEMVIDG